MSAGRATQPRELPRIVDEKQIPCVMKIFSNEFLRRKLKLDFVVGSNAWIERLVVASLNRHFPFVAKAHIEIDRLWWNSWISQSLYYLSFTRKLLFHGDSGPAHCCQQKQTAYIQSGYSYHDGSPVDVARSRRIRLYNANVRFQGPWPPQLLRTSRSSKNQPRVP
jgi:hypothetical protein